MAIPEITPKQAKIIKKCRADPAFFINNFCKITHPSAGIIPMKLFGYQHDAVKAFQDPNIQHIVFHKVRQCGISTLCGAYALWYAMFQTDKLILIVSKKDEDAKEFLRRNVRFIYSELPKWMRDIWSINPIDGGNDNSHELRFPQGSRILSLTSSPTVMRSHSASFFIIDEAAFIQDMDAMWEGGAPSLTHGGRAFVVSCVTPDTYVFTDDGMAKIGDLVDQSKRGGYTVPEYRVMGRGGMRSGNILFNSGHAKTRKITTRFSELEGSLEHKLWVRSDGYCGWKRMGDIKVGDWVQYQYGMNVWGNDDSLSGFTPSENVRKKFHPKKITPEIAYMFGLYLAEGCVEGRKKNGTVRGVTITCGDSQIVIDACKRAGLPCQVYDGLRHHVVNKNFVELLEFVGFDLSLKAWQKVIPPRLLRCSGKVVAALLRGMFDGDGCAQPKKISYASTSPELARQVRLLLANFGVLATKNVRFAADANAIIRHNIKNGIKPLIRRHNYDATILEITGHSADVFMRRVGFGLKRKRDKVVKRHDLMANRCDIIPFARSLVEEVYDALPFGTNALRKRYGIRIDTVRCNRSADQQQHVTRKLMGSIMDAAVGVVDPRLTEEMNLLLAPNLRWVKVEKIEKGSSEVYDFSLPDNPDDPWAHSVSYNGIIGHQTPNGSAGWYYRTVMDAQKKLNNFHLVKIDWTDMSWKISFKDEHGKMRTICPTDGIRKAATEEEREKYGEWVSPWLEEQYRLLCSDGNDKKFRQEVLHEFLGTGDTILPRLTLERMGEASQPPKSKVGKVTYRNPITEEVYTLDFHDSLWLWEPPVRGIESEDPKKRVYPHVYAIGADASPGDGNGDPSAACVWDLTTMEQVAEMNLHVETKEFAKMLDFIGRSYNNAIIVVERDPWGTTVIQELNTVLSYPNLYRHQKEKASLKKVWQQYGYPATNANKSALNANLIQCLSENGGYISRSVRLFNEALVYIQINATKVGASPGSGNHDDLVIAAALGLMGGIQAKQTANPLLIPMSLGDSDAFESREPIDPTQRRIRDLMGMGGRDCLAPMSHPVESEAGGDYPSYVQNEIAKFTRQLGAVPPSAGGGVTSPRVRQINKPRYPWAKKPNVPPTS